MQKPINLAVIEKYQILYIDRVKTESFLSINLEIGLKLPAYCTSMGRVLLAWLPMDDVRTRLAPSPMKRYTPRTITHRKALEKILVQVKMQGYAVNAGELGEELYSAAAAVFNRQGDVVAALNMAVSAARHRKTYIQKVMVPAVVSYTARISSALGFFKEEAPGRTGN